MEREHCRLTVLFAISTAVALLQWACVFGCGCPNSSRVSQKIIPSLQFRKRAPSSVSAMEETMKRKMAHSVKNAPLSWIGLPSFGDHPIKIWPQAWLGHADSDKYNESEWMFSIMTEAWKQMVMSG
jgi:hypothetical protein